MRLLRSKLVAFCWHLLLGTLVVVTAAALAFALWYPYPYRELSGGRALFFLVVGVDVALGPLITFAVFNPAKSRREKLLDFSVIGLLQAAALAYGLWTAALARPVHTVFEYDRFRVVSAAEVAQEALAQAPAGLRDLSWTGPTWLALRALTANEQMDVTMAAMSGLPVSARPELWRPYASERAAVLKAARPAAELRARFAGRAAEIEQVLKATQRPTDGLAYLPLLGRDGLAWTVVLDARTAEPVAYLALDSF